MNRFCDSGRRLSQLSKSGSAEARFALEARSRCVAALLLLLPLAVVSTTAAVAEEPQEADAQSGPAYILNLENMQPLHGGDSSSLEAWPGFSAVSSPTGVFLPDASAYFNLDGSDGEFTYLTPRMQGVQVTWTAETADRSVADGGHGAGSQAYVSKPKSIGASFAQGGDDVEFSLGGDYGRSSQSVPGVVRLTDDEKLLRVGGHARIHQFTLGGAFGSDIDPSNLGQTLSWDAFGRYDFGALAIGLVYNYTVESDNSSGAGGGMPGTLQGGVSYSFTPRMAISTNLAYGSYVDQGGSDDSAIAGVLGFSLDF